MYLTLIRMAGGVNDSWNFERIQHKVAWSKNIFYPRCIPPKIFLELYLVEGFYLKNAVYGQFSMKKYDLTPVYGGDFMYSCQLGVIYAQGWW